MAPTSAAADPAPTAEPGTRPPLAVAELDDLLLDEVDLGGVDVVGPMSFSAEPRHNVVDCDPMADLFAAHEGTGRRIRAVLDDGALRMSAVDLGDTATAEAVLDAADVVWEMCTLVTTDVGETWWLEPVAVPAVDGWRTSGLAIGLSEWVWTIGWYQRGSVVVFVDYDAANPWKIRRELFAAIAARLVGSSDPVEPPVIEPAATATPDPVPTPMPTPESWLDHLAARYLPEADFFGDGWTRSLGEVLEAAPSDPGDAIEGCDVAPPPTMEGLEVTYESSGWEDVDNLNGPVVEAQVMVGVGDAEVAAATLAAFRLAAGCPAEVLDGSTFEEVAVEPGAADEIVALEVVGMDDRLEDGAALIGRVVLARYGPDLVGVLYGGVFPAGTESEVADINEIAGWIDQWVADAE